MLMSKVWDKDYIETAGAFYTSMKEQRKLMEDYDLFARVRDIKAKGDWDKLTDDERSRLEQGVVTITKVRSLLNDRELIAIGIREGTYDEVIFRRWWYSTFMKEWRSASALVSRIRSDPESGATQYAYRDMEALARRWEAEGPWQPRERHIRLFGGRVLTIHRSR